jgi:putative DNA primase/helicase
VAMMDLQDFLNRLESVKSLPSGFSARCPAHSDHVSSLMVNAGKNQPIVVHCHAGCETSSVLTALGLSTTDLMGKPKVVAVYRYVHADGSTAYEVERWTNPKTFRVRGQLPVPAERVLYQLPALDWARSAGATVYVVEGEKCADRLISMGLIATTNVSGAGSWLAHYAEQLHGVHSVIIADNDVPGRMHARHVASTLKPYALTVNLCVPRHGKDVSDLLDAGYTLDHLDPLSETDDLAAYVASNVRTRRVEWAWHNYMAIGKLSIVEGDPGDGKSVLTVDLAARWSSGAPMPDGFNHEGPWPVFMVSAEDDPEDTIVPRLIAAGAKLDYVTLFPHGSTPDQPFTFAADLAALERRALEVGARIIIFDPLAAFLSSSVDTHNDMQVRQALYPLKSLAVRTRSAVVAVRHLNKGSQGTKAIYRGNGSIAFGGAARAGFVVAKDPEEPQVRVLACVKTNLSHMPPSLRYSIESTEDEVPYLMWRGATETTAQQALDGPRKFFSEMDEDDNSNSRVRQYEIDFLRDLLVEGPMAWKEIVRTGKEDGFTEHSLRRARADAGLKKVTGSDGLRSVQWALREEFSTAPEEPELPLDHLPTVDDPLDRATSGEGKWSSGASGTLDSEATLTDQERSEALEQCPRTCSVCGTTTDVLGFHKPWWVYRCIAHDPRSYGADNGH